MESRDELLLRVMAESDEAGWWKPEHSVVAAVSGGPDSMAMLDLLRRMRQIRPFRLVAAHVNHRFRPAESAGEAELVRNAALGWGVPFEMTEIDVPGYIAETGMNAQSAAREKRYAYLRQVAAEHGATHLLLGHHADDQAETVLMRILRGTGIGGLGGIPYRRREGDLELIRPLLRITKWELLTYCERNGVPYAVDSSNLNRRYLRNAIRLDVLPELEKFNPRLKESLIRLAETASVEDDYMDGEAARRLAELGRPAGQGFRLDRRRFARLHVALQRRVIKLILSYSASSCHFLEFRQVDEMLHAAGDGRASVSRIDAGGGWVFEREYDELYIGPVRAEPRAFRCAVLRPADAHSSVNIADAGIQMDIERVQGTVSSPPEHRWEAFFDESELVWPLVVRSREPGDRMDPNGLNGSKKVQDMFVDAKVPRSLRGSWPLLADADGRVLWVPGLRRSRHALVGADTRTTIRIIVRGTALEPRTTAT